MTDFLITAPDGQKYKVTGDSQEGAIAALKKMLGGQQDAPASPNEANNARAAAARAGTLPQITPERAAQQAAIDQMAMPAPQKGLLDYVKDGLGVSDPAKALGAGMARGASQLVGLPGTVADGMDWAAKRAGLLSEDAPGSMLSGQSIQDALGAATGGATEFRAPGFVGKAAGTVGEMIGGGAGAKLGAASGIASEIGGKLTEGTAAEHYARFVGALAGGLAYQGVSGLVNAAQNNKAARAFIDKTPDVDALKSAAGDLYEAARVQGVTADPAAVMKLGGDLTSTLRSEGVITPKGNMAGSYPKVADAMRLIDDYAGSAMTPTEMLQVRKSFQAAARSADPSEARLGTIMIRQFDDFTSPLAPQIAEANQIYRSAMQGDLIETTIELAGSKAGQFSGSGFENALRTEFRSLERKLIKGQMTATDDEAALITRIAQGGFAENLARDIGKAAPRGVVSTGMAGGVPFAVGTSMGGPALGGLLAGATLGAGEVGRRVATAMQAKNAGLLSAIARNGGALPSNITKSAGSTSLLRAIPGLLAQ